MGDPQAWRQANPALGHTVSEAAVRAAMEAMTVTSDLFGAACAVCADSGYVTVNDYAEPCPRGCWDKLHPPEVA